MASKRRIVAIALVALILFTSLFVTIRIRSSPGVAYDPWADLNDDGTIDILDCIVMGNAFGASDEPINKTALLFQVNDTFTGLLSRIDDLNNSLNELQSKVDGLNVTNLISVMNELNATIMQLNSRVYTLESSYSSLLDRIVALETNYSVPAAIPFKMVFNDTYDTTHEQWPNWVDLGGMSVTLNLSRSSQILILWTGELQNLGDSGQDPREDSQTYIRALVNNTAVPLNGYATANVDPTSAIGLVGHSHYMRWGGYTFTFCSSPLAPGFYTIQVQWTCHLGMAEVQQRQLTVIALPT